MSFPLEGKSAIVTGAGGGINLAFAIKLLEAGVNVVIADQGLLPEAEQVIAKYTSQPRAIFEKTDVSSWSELESLFQAAIGHFGVIDIVCPGAGVFEPSWSAFWAPPGSGPAKDDASGSRYKSLDINLTHPIRLAQMAISHFLESKNADGSPAPKRLVFIASIAGEITTFPLPLYHTSKWGIMGFIRSIADLGTYFNIRVGGVAPGIVKTRLWTEDAAKMAILTYKETGKVQDSFVTVEEVADAMMAIVRDNEVDDGKGGKIPINSGVVLEVASGALRDVPMLNNQGPDMTAPGMILANMAGGYEGVIGALQQPGWGKF